MGKLQAVPGELQAAGTMDAKAEAISLLVDGELEHERVEHACSSLREPGCIRTWVCYHVIGDALRGAATMPAGFARGALSGSVGTGSGFFGFSTLCRNSVCSARMRRPARAAPR